MSKKFADANSANIIKNIAKASNEKANVIQVKMISNENLVDYPKNHEDLNATLDLENSIKELGFTDPIEVTAFGMEEGKYMIVSGHRRRVAGVKCGMDTFPCIIKFFNNEHDLRNYVLLANSQRDSSKDPLLFCKRYKMHEEYLKESGFKGSVREEIAKRLGISTQQADRYNQFNRIILPVWDMVRDEVVGMSSVLPMATHSVEEQEEILEILNECIDQGDKLTRELCDKIIKGYRNGCKSYEEITELYNPKDIEQSHNIEQDNESGMRDSGMALNAFINTEPTESSKGGIISPNGRNNEIRREYDPVSYEDGNKDPYANERLTEADYAAIDAVTKENEKSRNEDNEKKTLTEEELKLKRGTDISKHLEGLQKCFEDIYSFPNDEMAEKAMQSMCEITIAFYEEIFQIGTNYGKEELFDKIVRELQESIKSYV